MGSSPSSPLTATSCHLGSPAPATCVIHAALLRAHSVAVTLLRACDMPETLHTIHFVNSEQNCRLCPTSQVAQEVQSTNSYHTTLQCGRFPAFWTWLEIFELLECNSDFEINSEGLVSVMLVKIQYIKASLSKLRKSKGLRNLTNTAFSLSIGELD